VNKTERIFKIEQLVASRRLVSFQALLDELEVSRATLKRDLEYLRSRMVTHHHLRHDATVTRLTRDAPVHTMQSLIALLEAARAEHHDPQAG
jgi:predicted DNA-binding transcriptional regulator YafY